MTNHAELIAELCRHNLFVPLLQRQIIAEAVCNEEILEEEYSQARQAFIRNNGIEDDTSINDFMKQKGWKEQDMRWQIELPTRIKKHCEKKYRHKTEAHFLKRKNQLDKVVYSLIRVKDHFLANEIYWRIKEGEVSFGNLAAEYSEGPERTTQGIIGPVPMLQAHPVLAEALRVSKSGELIGPIQIDEWTLIARLETYKPATFDKEMATRLSQELFDQWIDKEVRRRLAVYNETAVSPWSE